MNTEQPRTYKHQLTAEEFIFAFTATSETFAVRAEEMRGKGVERLTGRELWGRDYNLASGKQSDHLFTLLTDVEITGEYGVKIMDLEQPVPHLLLWKSKSDRFLFHNCKLKKGDFITSFYFSQSVIDNLDIQRSSIGRLNINQSKTRDISIESSDADVLIIIDSKTGGVNVYAQSKTGDVLVDRSKTGDFWIDQSTTGEFRILEKSETGEFKIDNQSKTGGFSIFQSTTGNFTINEKSLTGMFNIWHQSKVGVLILYGQSKTGDFDIRGSKADDFHILDQSQTGDFSITDSELPAFTADGLTAKIELVKATIPLFRITNSHLPEVRFSAGCRMECYIANSSINLIDLQHVTLGKDSVVSFYDCTVYACLMEEFAVLGNLFFRQIKKADAPFTWPVRVNIAEQNEAILQEKQFTDYETHRKKLVEEIPTATFRVAQSSLGKTEFTDCELADFRFEFNNAKIVEVFMSGGKAPSERIHIHGVTPKTLKWAEQKVSVYTQLKKVFDNQGDIYWSTHFQAKTAEHQERLLKWRVKESKKWLSPARWDILTFRLNSYSNLHGESWGRALGFTLGAAAFFYALFLWSIGRLFLPTSLDWELMGQYFQFLDPTHKTDFVKGATLNFGSYAADYVGRVFVGYGIFQFIAAFRKHGKK